MPSRDVVRALTRAPRPRVYLDESVGRWVADVLNIRENVQTAEQAGLLGHADPDHFAYCWRHRRVLLTHDFDFFNYKNPELPDTRNPGVIVFNCDSRDLKSVEKILTFLPRFWAVAGDAGWRRTRSVVSADGSARIRWRSGTSGQYQLDTFRIGPRGPFEPAKGLAKRMRTRHK